MAGLNSVSKTFKGSSALTTANAQELYAVAMDVSSTLTNGVESQVTLTGTTEDKDEIIGAYHRNPGADGNEVGVNVCGEFEIQVAAAITAANLGFGLVSSTTAGIPKVAGTIGTGFGKILGGRTDGTKHFARIFA